ncbi:ABC transporter permease [Paenibacillus septentrionalis]|uniref:Transport permease protein n=1 Tax=Paenibacillus septentrionalis TaxID=429342 RepID=A0ABW1VAX0_9BACL
MEALFSLVGRNSKVFRRDKTSVFFSLLSVIIVIVLYALFLQKMQVDSINQLTEATPQMITMVNEWLIAGLLSMIAVTTTLAAFGIAIKDIETKARADFLTAPVSRATIQMGYVLNACMIGSVFSIIALIGCEIYIVATGGAWLSFTAFIKVVGIILLSVLLASLFNVVLVMFVHTLNAFSTLSTIVGTLLGFLCGVYVPIGALPSFAQNVIMYFPISHTTLLLRNAFMDRSLAEVFAGAPAEAAGEYKLLYGVTYKLHGNMLNLSTSYMVIAVTIVVLAVLSIVLFRRNRMH